jgi:hypothetical protein
MKFLTILPSDLKTRFRAKSEKIRVSPATRVSTTSSRSRKLPGTLSHYPFYFCPFHLLISNSLEYKDAPALPLPDGSHPKGQMQEMEEFLDELLT